MNRCHAASRERLGLLKAEFQVLKRLRSPQHIQDFLNCVPTNHEIGGETLFSVRNVLAHRRAHCMEAAMLAACALWIHGESPLVMRLGCDPSDYPHVVALFRRGTRWGAISKSNGVYLRFRDPVYTSLRELVMSYFHEYANKFGRKTLRSYSTPLDLRRLDTTLWVTASDNCWLAHDRLERTRHYPLLNPKDARCVMRRDSFERSIAKLEEHADPRNATTTSSDGRGISRFAARETGLVR
jgi:hypothetical protein